MPTGFGGDGDLLLQLKLEAPRQPSNVVGRPRLMAVLDTAEGARLTLLTAPAGFGKTTLLVQWREHLVARGHGVGWVSLDQGDRDARQFLSSVIRALSACGLDVAALAVQAAEGLRELTIGGVLTAIRTALAQSPRPIALILDDYHHAAGPELDEIVHRLVTLLPDRSRLCISSRHRPEVEAARLLANGTAVEITSEMLRFTDCECRQVVGLDLGDAEFLDLVDQVEGWPVAVQLARLVMLQEHNRGASLVGIGARGGRLSDYLTDQILKGLREEAVDFLLETSILDRFNVEITDAFRRRTDSWAIVDSLRSLQSFLTPIDADGAWFRYHHLFADYLKSQLHQRRPGAVAELHARASEVYERQGLLLEAVRHASLAGDYYRCASLVEAAGGWRLVLYGGMAELAQLLSFIPPAERLSHPRLLLADAYLSLKNGDLAQARATFDLVSAEQKLACEDWNTLDDHSKDALNIGALIRTYEDNDISEPFVASFAVLRRVLSDADGLTRGVIDCAGAVANLCLGRLHDAEAFARDAMGAMRSVNSILGLNYCYLHAGLACLYRGEVRTAHAYLTQAQAMAVENFGADSGLRAVTDVLLGVVVHWRSGAQAVAAPFGEAFRHVCDYDGWFEIYAAGLEALFWRGRGEADRAAMDAAISQGAAIAAGRRLARLDALVAAQRVLRRCDVQDYDGAAVDAHRLGRQFPLGCWRSRPSQWRPYQDVGFALSAWHGANEPRRAHAIASDLVECATAFGAVPYQARALALRAAGRLRVAARDDAMADLARAVELATPEGLKRPFLELAELAPTLSLMRRSLLKDGSRPLEAAFLTEVVETLSKASDRPAGGAPPVLSARECEVMEELTRGATNKEIARALDMTEHTVKFHLKNIFAKLGVDRRARALSSFNALKRAGAGGHLTGEAERASTADFAA